MNEHVESQPEKIDLIDLIQDILKGVKKLWPIILGLTLLFASKAYFTVSYNYVPQYVASATTAIRSSTGGGSYIDQTTAEQMAEIFPYIMKSGVLQNAILEDMGLNYMPGSISMTVENGTNFFTVSANASDPQVAYDLLKVTLRQYPKVAEFAVGRIEMVVVDETGIPKNTGRESIIRGSVINGAIKGMTLGLLLLGAYVLLRNKVKKEKELKKIINLDSLGSIPYIRAKKRRKKAVDAAVTLNQERVSAAYMEAIRKVRYKVMKEMEMNGHRSLLITSSVSGEGKTTLAVNLAIAMAHQGKKVVLVDCDVRNPSVAKALSETEPHPGFAAILKKEVPMAKAMTTVNVKDTQLQVIYGGEPDAKAAHLLGTEQMGKFIKTLEEYADVVILDTAPSEILADATVLAKYVGAALYVVRCDFVNKWRIRKGVQLLGESNIKILGYVFNADTSKSNRSYGYGYNSYGSYYGYGGYGGYGAREQEDKSGRVRKD